MACPVCYNAAASDETVRASLNLGIAVLLGVTGCVLAGFLRFIVSIARRSRTTGLVDADLVDADLVDANLVGADLKVRLSSSPDIRHGTSVEAGPQTRLGTEAP